MQYSQLHKKRRRRRRRRRRMNRRRGEEAAYKLVAEPQQACLTSFICIKLNAAVFALPVKSLTLTNASITFDMADSIET